MTPDVFTQTPVEGLIQTMGYGASAAVSQLLTTESAVVLWVLVMATLAMRASLQSAGGFGMTPYGRWFVTFALSLIGWSLIGVPSGTGLQVGPVMDPELDSTWNQLGAVNSDPDFAVMTDPVDTMWGFRFVNGIFESLSASMTSSVSSAIEVTDPLTHARNALELSTYTLGKGSGDVLASFDTLAKNCYKQDNAPIAEPGMPLSAMFSNSIDPLYDGGPDCVTLYRNFQDSTGVVMADVQQDLSAHSQGDALAFFGQMLNLPGAMSQDEYEAFQTNTVIGNTLLKFMTESNGASPGEIPLLPDWMGNNELRKNKLTMNNGADDMYQALIDDPMGQGMGALMKMMGDENYFLRQQKLAAAQKFNEKADLIPIIRGYVHVIFAVTFPIAVYGLVLGMKTPLLRWMIGRMVLAMYTPFAAIAYGVAANFTRMSGIGNDVQIQAMLTGGDLVTGSSVMLQAQALRVQTGYLYLEIGLVSAMLIGSLGPLMMGGWSFGASAMAAAGSQARVVAKVARGGAAAAVPTSRAIRAGHAQYQQRRSAGAASSTPAVRARPSISLPTRGPGDDK